MTDAQAQLAAAIWPPDREAPTREIRCRHCGRTNRVRIPSAVMSPERHDCGACHGRLFLTPDEPLTGIPSAAYEHGLDRKSLSALKSVPGFPALMRFVLKHVGERSSRLLFMSDSILCSEDQFPELLELLGVARDRLGVGLSPTLFLGESPYMNAMTTGVEEQLIVVRSALLDQLTDEEVMAVLGHELGHLHADHPLYQTLAWAVLLGGSLWSGLVRILSWPLQRALLKWLRCAELTADRAGLLATRDLDASIGVFVKLAGGNRPGTHLHSAGPLHPPGPGAGGDGVEELAGRRAGDAADAQPAAPAPDLAGHAPDRVGGARRVPGHPGGGLLPGRRVADAGATTPPAPRPSPA